MGIYDEIVVHAGYFVHTIHRSWSWLVDCGWPKSVSPAGEQLDCGCRTNAMVGLNLLWIILARSRGTSSSQQSRSHFYKQLTNTAFYGEKGQSQECEANRQIKWIRFYCFETDIQINVPLAWDYNFRPLAHKEKQCNTNGNGLHLAQGDITSSTAVVHVTL